MDSMKGFRIREEGSWTARGRTSKRQPNGESKSHALRDPFQELPGSIGADIFLKLPLKQRTHSVLDGPHRNQK
ncbi:hypothetical protein Tcan_13673 [Toxocara canis]|uniref:Uncharacterized protein n=1 Tax=Toxocara canis TaxID=6265 RepID=A0A0B2VH98_TOXCA|nr:hypothetical protein Tcan_13673 [Toxocara canis]